MPANKPDPIEPSSQADNPEQYRRFVDMAREIEADETPGVLDRVFERIDVRSRPEDERQPRKKRSR